MHRFFIAATMAVLVSGLWAQNTAETSSTVQEVRIGRTESAPLMPETGKVSAFRIESHSQFLPGQLADGFLGDIVLENNSLRAVIGRLDKPVYQQGARGHIIDIANRKNPVDYINFIMTTGDQESSSAEVLYTEMEEPTVLGNTTATLVLRGKTGKPADPESTESQPVLSDVDVVTTYELPVDQPWLLVSTSFTNNSTQPVSLLPGDVADWGLAGTFIEQNTPAGGVMEKPTRFVIGTADDFSVGLITSGTEAMEGAHTSRMSMIRGFGHGPFARLDAQKTPRPASAAPETAYSPSGVPPPGTETNYRAIPKAPSQTGGTPVPSPQPPSVETTYKREGGGDNSVSQKDLPSTGTKMDNATSVATESASTSESRLLLKPGESYTFSRYVFVSDGDLSRITNFAYKLKNVPTGGLAGAVLEVGTNRFLPGAEVYISGGSDWNPMVGAPAVTKVLTNSEGTYGARLPAGKYVVRPAKNGRTHSEVSDTAPIQLEAGGMPRILPLTLSGESFLRIGISAAETPTSVPLPCKVTLTAKPGTPAVNFGFHSDLSRGVRNVYYLPRGGAVIPVTPGRYQMVVSRGPEYETLQGDLTILAGKDLEILRPLVHAWHGQQIARGYVSVDMGLMTTASASALNTPRDTAIMAACEGVSVIVSGDWDKATDLQQAINELGLQAHVKAFMGMRFLVEKNGFAANLLVYPLTPPVAEQLLAFRKKSTGLPPDIFLSDLKREFPNIIVQIDRPMDPEQGYLKHFPFDSINNTFSADEIPPPDFDALQMIDGKKVGLRLLTFPRYDDLVMRYMNASEPGLPPAPVGNSSSRLPHGEEVGYPRVYIRTDKSVSEFTGADLVAGIRNHRFVGSNSYLPVVEAAGLDHRFSHRPGDVMDIGGTVTVVLQTRVLAASWIDLSGMDLIINGKYQDRREIAPGREVVRYPKSEDPAISLWVGYVGADAIAEIQCRSGRRGLDPVVPANPLELGGRVRPFAWTAPFFIDRDGDGRVRPKEVPITEPFE